MPSKLELTWYGKDKPIKVEPRILIENKELSNVGKDENTENMLIHGDNLLALKALEKKYSGKIKCIYIDPPFNTGQAFENYDDNLEMSIWLDLMRSRLVVLQKLLKDDGTLFVHMDDQNLPYLTILLDEIFGKNNRLYLITFKQGAPTGHKAINPGCVTTTNFVLIYSKNKALWKPHRVFTRRGRDDRYSKYITNIEDPYEKWNIITLLEAYANTNDIDVKTARRRIKDNPNLLEQFVISNGISVIRTAQPDIKNVGKEVQDMVRRSKKEPTEIFFLHRDNNPDMYFINGERILFYKDKLKNIDGELVSAEPLTTLWDDILSNNLHNEGGVSFPKGKKPEHLIKRILELSTNVGDLVLDSFLGSGTTAAVAHKMKRRYIGIEMGDHAYTHCKVRLDKVIDGSDQGGISKSLNWQGGGGYRFYELAPTLINKDAFDEPIINKEYSAEMLASAVALHEGFEYKPSSETFWKQSVGNENSYLFVTTRHVDLAYLSGIKESMEDNEYLIIACKSFAQEANGKFPNIKIKKIPQMLLDKCEFGRDNYNLNIIAPPTYEDDNEDEE
jgi:adenine-specific DNA-methyltransferase